MTIPGASLLRLLPVRLLFVLSAALAALAVGAAPAAALQPNGTFVQVPGTAPVYEVIGGALIHVDSCTSLGACKPIVDIPSTTGYASVPATGTFIRIADGALAGYVDEVFGGTLIHVDDCAPLAGCPGVRNLDGGGAADYTAAHPTPANGTFLRIANGGSAGYIGEFFGGALIHVDSCTPLPGCATAASLDAGGAADDIRAHPLPPNGTFIRVADGRSAGWVGVVVGNALIHVDDRAPLGVCPGDAALDSGGWSDYMSAHPLPPDGSFMKIANGAQAGSVDEVIGTSLVHVGNCAVLNGCPGVVSVDVGGIADYQAAHPVPTDGTFVEVADGSLAGTIARVAGGALLPISSCAEIGGCPNYTTLDSGGYGAYVAAHPHPVDGTLLVGAPSGTTWEVLDGERVSAAASPDAIVVNDGTLTTIPLAPAATSGTAATGTSTPVSSGGPKVRRQTALHLVFVWRWNRGRTQLRGVRIGRLTPQMRVRAACTGPRCPRHLLIARTRHVKAALRRLIGSVYHAGDRLTITVSEPHRQAERIAVRIRTGEIPDVELRA